MSVEISGLFGLIIFILDVLAIIKTIQSPASTGSKVLWIVIILLLPVIGLLLWFFLGPRARIFMKMHTQAMAGPLERRF